MYSPLELEQIVFEKKAFGGYNMEDVDKTFAVLKRDYEELYIENAEMKKQVKELRAALSESEGMKEALQTVLLTAQKTSDDLKSNAEKEAQLIVQKAEAEAQSALQTAQREVEESKRKKEAVQNEVEAFITKMCALFEAQVKYLSQK